MSINDTLLVECVRAHPVLYDKGHAGFKYPSIKDTTWKNVAQKMNASARDCMGRWQTLRERFVKEKRLLEEGMSGAANPNRPEWPLYKTISFITPHIRKRKCVENFPRFSLPVTTSSPTMLSTDEESLSVLSPGCQDKTLEEESVDDASAASPMCTSSAAAGKMPHCKKQKMDEMAQMLKETLTALNKSMATYIAAAPLPPLSIDVNTPDVLIGQSVELCLKNIKDMRLKLKCRKKFRALIQECEEAVEDQHDVEEAQQALSKMADKSVEIHLTNPFGNETNQTEIKLANQMTSPNICVNNNPSRLSKEVSSEPQEVIQEDKSLPTVPEIASIFAKCIASQMKHLPKSVCNLLRREIKVLVESKRNSNSFSADPQETSCDKDKFVKNEMDIEEFVIQD